MNDCIDIRIYYEDTDCGGVVYYGKYLAFLERARTDFFERRGIRLSQLMEEGIFFVVTEVTIHYHMPARYADIISVCSEITEVKPASLVFNHRLSKKKTSELLVTSSVRLAFVDRNMKPLKIRRDLREALHPI